MNTKMITLAGGLLKEQTTLKALIKNIFATWDSVTVNGMEFIFLKTLHDF